MIKINEKEAHVTIALIDAFTEFKKNGALIAFLEACKNVELIDENNKFCEGDFRQLRSFRKKLNELAKRAS